jgi:thermitase
LTTADVAAPGVNVYSTFPNHKFVIARQSGRSYGYDVGSGTSMAAPVVAGVAALAWRSHAGATNESVRANVELTAEMQQGQESYWAHGRVNANDAVR